MTILWLGCAHQSTAEGSDVDVTIDRVTRRKKQQAVRRRFREDEVKKAKLASRQEKFDDDKLDASGRVRDHTMAEVRAADAGSKFSPRFAGERILTPEEGLRLARGRINPYLDCKDVDPALLASEVLMASSNGSPGAGTPGPRTTKMRQNSLYL
jgi:glycerophosphoryl diester phosphodiesterase